MNYSSRLPSFREIIIELLRQRLPLFDNFNNMLSDKQTLTLANIMGLTQNTLLDTSESVGYQITVDNCLKLLAIYLRFVSNIPVVIMGETGCGKTRLIRFFAELHQSESEGKSNCDHILKHVKVHGGMTSEELVRNVEEAEKMAAENAKVRFGESGVIGGKITAILFFDEANTTEHVGLIKEIMCDLTVNGRKIDVRKRF
jgi:ABC-type glutathione transport system ATPase component